MLDEFVAMRDVFKFRKPYKYHRSSLSGSRPRSHYLRKPWTYVGLKKIPLEPEHYRHHGPTRNSWHEPYYEDTQVGSEPYTIEIELPKRHESRQWTKGPYNRNYGYELMEDDYNDEDETPMQTIMKGIRIKVVKGAQPKLKIKLSRDDSDDRISETQS